MVLSLKAGEHIRVHSDTGAAFVVHIEDNEIHIRAKAKDEPRAGDTTLVIDSPVEVTK